MIKKLLLTLSLALVLALPALGAEKDPEPLSPLDLERWVAISSESGLLA